MFYLNTLKSLMNVLQADDNPMQVAGGVALGLLAGFAPGSGLLAVICFLLIMFVNVNLGAAALSTALFALLALLLDPLAHQIGYLLLVKMDALTPFWTALYNMPIVPFTRFNNTVVLGSLVLALLMFVPVLFGSKALVLTYRARWKDKVAKLGVMKLFQLTKVADVMEKKK